MRVIREGFKVHVPDVAAVTNGEIELMKRETGQRVLTIELVLIASARIMRFCDFIRRDFILRRAQTTAASVNTRENSNVE